MSSDPLRDANEIRRRHFYVLGSFSNLDKPLSPEQIAKNTGEPLEEIHRILDKFESEDIIKREGGKVVAVRMKLHMFSGS